MLTMNIRAVLLLALWCAGLCAAPWVEFAQYDDIGPSEFDMSAWLDKPAGVNGFVQIQNDKLVFENGKPVKFWGTNHGNMTCAPEKSDAVFRARRFAKYGINCVRMHKFTWHGDREGLGSADDSTKLDPARFDLFDYYCGQLRSNGVYYGWSHIYGHRLRPGDRGKVLAYNEVVNSGSAHLRGSSLGLVHFARDLQDLSIQLTTNMLQHVNPYTGKHYADDAALAFIELQNEDDIFFPTTLDKVNACPTYKKLFCEQFSDWLRAKYKSQANLVRAWGLRALNAYPEWQDDESLTARNIYPIAHAWYFSPEGLRDQQQKKGTGRRLLDTARFLYETQCAYYERFSKAIRSTGYKGPLVGSCWQAGSGVSHYYNLLSDARVGIVDRHNYFGGSGHTLHPGPVQAAAMLNKPGSGLLSSGFQQVAERPFALSEWMCMPPNEWVAEGAPIIAVYGLGLQGWDASYQFASKGSAARTIDSPNVYNIDVPTQMGLYPSLARMLYRGDVQEGALLAERVVSLEGLQRGWLGFRENVSQDGDAKSIAGDIPPETLAAGRVRVRFTQKPESNAAPALAKYVNGKVITSSTGQLRWDYSGKGWFTVNTPGTKAVVGFAGGVPQQLDEIEINVATPFAVVFVTAMERAATLQTSTNVLVNIVGRARNTGMEYNAAGTELKSVGTGPILLEPIRATIKLTHTGTPTVWVLDNDGRRTKRTLPVTDGAFELDTARDKTIYYQVTYAP
jgi:hypothetical protein